MQEFFFGGGVTLGTDIHHGIIIAENYIEYIKDMSLAESVILIESKKKTPKISEPRNLRCNEKEYA